LFLLSFFAEHKKLCAIVSSQRGDDNVKIKTVAKGLLTALLLAAAADAAHAFTPNMMTLGRTNPPIGHYEFCQQYPAQCASNGTDPGPLQLTEARWKAILQVNYKVNSSIEPESGSIKRMVNRSKVDFPQPLGPMRMVVVPRSTERLVECKAVASA